MAGLPGVVLNTACGQQISDIEIRCAIGHADTLSARLDNEAPTHPDRSEQAPETEAIILFKFRHRF